MPNNKKKKTEFEAGTYKIKGSLPDGKAHTCWLRFGKTVDRATVERLSQARVIATCGKEFTPKRIEQTVAV